MIIEWYFCGPQLSYRQYTNLFSHRSDRAYQHLQFSFILNRTNRLRTQSRQKMRTDKVCKWTFCSFKPGHFKLTQFWQLNHFLHMVDLVLFCNACTQRSPISKRSGSFESDMTNFKILVHFADWFWNEMFKFYWLGTKCRTYRSLVWKKKIK